MGFSRAIPDAEFPGFELQHELVRIGALAKKRGVESGLVLDITLWLTWSRPASNPLFRTCLALLLGHSQRSPFILGPRRNKSGN